MKPFVHKTGKILFKTYPLNSSSKTEKAVNQFHPEKRSSTTILAARKDPWMG